MYLLLIGFFFKFLCIYCTDVSVAGWSCVYPTLRQGRTAASPSCSPTEKWRILPWDRPSAPRIWRPTKLIPGNNWQSQYVCTEIRYITKLPRSWYVNWCRLRLWEWRGKIEGFINVKRTSGAGLTPLESDSFGKAALNGLILYWIRGVWERVCGMSK